MPAGAQLVTPAHGRGKIKKGGNPGNKGGGAYPAVLRAKARGLIDKKELIERLARIAAGEVGEIKYHLDAQGAIVMEFCETPTRDQIKAIELLAKIGELFTSPEKGTPGESNAPRVHVFAKNVAIVQNVHAQDSP